MRPTADAFWPSPLEPWSKYLTGAQGGDPGYDPTVRGTSGYTTWTDTTAAGQRYTYVITGVDRLWNESIPQQVTPG